MEMVKTNVNYVDPNTKENCGYNFETEAICVVGVTEKEKGVVKVENCILGSMNRATTSSMIGALIHSIKELLKEVPPEIAQMLILHELTKSDNKGEEEDVAGTSDEPERPSEQ